MVGHLPAIKFAQIRDSSIVQMKQIVPSAPSHFLALVLIPRSRMVELASWDEDLPESPPYTLPLDRIKHSLTVLHQELNSLILDLRVCHLPGQTLWSHDRRRKYDGDIHARHEVVAFMAHHSLEMEDQKLKNLSVHSWQIQQRPGHGLDLGVRVRDGSGFEEFVIDFVGDEWVGEAAEVLFEGRRDGMNV
jgi:hypothetical protein